MRVLSVLIIVLLSFSGLQAQEESYVILKETEGNFRGEAAGPQMVDYQGFTLHEIFKRIDPEYAFEIDNKKLRSERFTVNIKGDLSDKAWIIEEINEQLAQSGYEVKRTDRHPKIYVLGFETPGTCEVDSGTISGESQVNANWKGKCITINRLVEKINEWHPDVIIHVGTKGEVRMPQVKLRKANFKDIQMQLADQAVALLVSDVMSLSKYITAYR